MLLKDGPQVGQLVKSKSGRDKNRLFLIFDVLNETFVRVVDGDCRKIDNPKKKNLRHVQLFPIIAKEFQQRVSRGEYVDNAEVRRVIDNLAKGL